MHWPTLRTIALRECRDLLRDRRTILMIFLTPVVLYPVLGIGGYEFARTTKDQVSVIGFEGADHLPTAGPKSYGLSPLPATAWFAVTPSDGPAGVAAAQGLYRAETAALDFPPLLVNGQFNPTLLSPGDDPTRVKLITGDGEAALADGDIDLLVSIPANLQARLAAGEAPELVVRYRKSDERSKLADGRWNDVFRRWHYQLKEQRFLRLGLRTDFDNPVMQVRPQQDSRPLARAVQELAYELARYFPFILVMWALAGALHPAIDLTAGEKERGTLETLLLSPARRTEIVAGKFVAVWAFSALSALWNLLGLGGFIVASRYFLEGFEILHVSGLVWGALFIALLAALFAAVSIALGSYARSAKEGQYYLLPLFFIAMPLAFLPLAPGVELNWFYSIVPITGATLLLQKLLILPTSQVPWQYFPLVLLALAAWSALALGWAVAQFHRESVLFREAEGFSLAARMRRLFRKTA